MALALIAFATGAVLCAPGRARSAQIVAVANRCNSQTVDEAYARVRDYDRHGPGSSPSQLMQRFAAIAEVLSTLHEEREILDSVCSNETQKAQLFAEIAASIAWALALDSDIAAQLNASCPAAAGALPRIMLADAWLTMANVVNEAGGAVPQIFNDVITKVQARAGTVDLTLPAWADTSAYWRDQIRDKSRAEAATCPSPSPSASPH